MTPDLLEDWLTAPLAYAGSAGALLWAIALALLVGAALWLTRSLLLWAMREAKQTLTPWDDLAEDLARRLWPPTIVAIAVAAGAGSLPLPAALYQWGRWPFGLTIALQFAIWSGVLAQFLVLSLERLIPRHFDADHLSVVRSVIRVALWMLVLVTTLDNLGVGISSLLAGLGIGGLSFALAIQRLLGDLISTLTIALDQPFVEGDSVTVGEVTGRIVRIGLKTTRIRATTGEEWIIPNADMVTLRVRNNTHLQERRVTHTFTVGWIAQEKLRKIPAWLEACCQMPDVRFERARLIGMVETGFQFELCWVVMDTDLAVHQARQEQVLMGVAEVWEREGIGREGADKQNATMEGMEQAKG